MFTIEGQKPARRFDYDAYIKGRMAGKYVVTYIEEEIPEEDVASNSDDISPVLLTNPVRDYFNNSSATISLNSSDFFSSEIQDFALLYQLLLPKNNIPYLLRKGILNCRGAPVIKM